MPVSHNEIHVAVSIHIPSCQCKCAMSVAGNNASLHSLERPGRTIVQIDSVRLIHTVSGYQIQMAVSVQVGEQQGLSALTVPGDGLTL